MSKKIPKKFCRWCRCYSPFDAFSKVVMKGVPRDLCPSCYELWVACTFIKWDRSEGGLKKKEGEEEKGHGD